MNISDNQVIEIYYRALEKKNRHNVPYKSTLHCFGIVSWSALKKRALKLIAKGEGNEKI